MTTPRLRPQAKEFTLGNGKGTTQTPQIQQTIDSIVESDLQQQLDDRTEQVRSLSQENNGLQRALLKAQEDGDAQRSLLKSQSNNELHHFLVSQHQECLNVIRDYRRLINLVMAVLVLQLICLIVKFLVPFVARFTFFG